jgi:DNA-binding SARP family transcriptional activator
MSQLPHLELVTLGAPTARLDGAAPPPDVLWRKHLALLIYLALSPGMARTRLHLQGLLWPEKDDARSRHSLNEALRRLRVSLGAGRLLTNGDSVALEPAGLVVDLLAVPEATGPGPRGVFLEGFTVDDAPAFEEWAEATRTRHRTRGIRELVMEGQTRLAEGSPGEAREIARRILSLDPYSEPGARLAMRAAALAGDAAGALVEFHRFSVGLKPLGEEPSLELAALAQRIRDGRWREASGRTVTGEPPLAGREDLLREVAQWIAPSTNAGATVLLSGEPGTGMTRVQSEIVVRMALEGAVVSVVTPIETDQGTAWSTLRAVVRGGLLTAPGLVATDRRHLAVLASLVPEVMPGGTPGEVRDLAEVALALAAALRAISEEAPVLIGIDHAHLADGATLRTLQAAMQSLAKSRVFLLMTAARGDPDTPRELFEFQAEVGRALPGLVVELKPLDHAAMLQLVHALASWCVDAIQQDRLARRLLFESAGRPLLATTLLRGLADALPLRERAVAWPPPEGTFDSPLPVEVPQLIQSAVLAQAARLDKDSRQLLAAASLCGRVLDLELVAELSGAGSELAARLARLEQHHFLVLEGDRYVFISPLIPAVIERGTLTPGQVRELRQRAVDLLKGRSDLAARVLRAELQLRLSPSAESYVALLNAAGAALDAGDRRSARRSLALAETVVPEPPPSAGAPLQALRERLARPA